MISTASAPAAPRPAAGPHRLDPERLPQYLDQLYRAAWALSGSRYDAEDLVQETLLNVLKRPRWIHNDNELGYLLRALRNTFSSRYRVVAQRGPEQQLDEAELAAGPDPEVSAREIMEAIATAPELYREAVIAVDLLGLSYREAARALRTREATITTRLHRGRRHVAHQLRGDPVPC